MSRQTLIFGICLLVHVMLISVTSKLQNKTKTYILYPFIILNFVRSQGGKPCQVDCLVPDVFGSGLLCVYCEAHGEILRFD